MGFFPSGQADRRDGGVTELPQLWADGGQRSDLIAIRREMAELRAEVRARLPRMIVVNIASMIGVAGLVLAAGKFA